MCTPQNVASPTAASETPTIRPRAIGQKLVVWTNEPVPARATTGNNLTRKLNYTVRRGDSLYLIASRFRITVNDLVRWNKIDKNKILRPGQKLTMYVDVTAQSS